MRITTCYPDDWTRLASGVGLFIAVLLPALLCQPKAGLGEGGGTPGTFPLLAYAATNTAPAMPAEDPVWALYVKRGQAFTNCSKAIILPETPIRVSPAKNVPVKKKKAQNAAKRQDLPKFLPPKTKSTDNPCFPIIMPVPALPAICPD